MVIAFDEGNVRVIETDDPKLLQELRNAADPFIHELPVWMSKCYNHMLLSRIACEI